MEVYPTTMTINKGGETLMGMADVVEIDGELWAVLEWNTLDQPLTKVKINRQYWEDMEDGTWLYQMPVSWPESGEWLD